MIYWELMLKTEKVCDELRRLYIAYQSISALAEHLGVAKGTLRKKLAECKIEVRKRGGAHHKIDVGMLPENAADMSPDQLAEVTGYTENYCRKLLSKLRQKQS